MQHALFSKKSYPSDLSRYEQPVQSTGSSKLSLITNYGYQIIKHKLVGFVSGFVNLSSQNKTRICGCSSTYNCRCQEKKKPPSNTTLELLRQINAGFDPIELSVKRWAEEEKVQQLQEKQTEQEIIENYQKNHQIEKPKIKVYTVIEKPEQKPQEQFDLWQIAQEKLKVIRKRVQHWKKSGQVLESASAKPSESACVSASEHQVQEASPPVLSEQNKSASLEQNVEKSEVQISKQQKEKSVVYEGWPQKRTDSVPKECEKPKETSQPEVDKIVHQENDKAPQQAKTVNNPFLSSPPKKAFKLLDLMCQNSSGTNIFRNSPQQGPITTGIFTNPTNMAQTNSPQNSSSPFVSNPFKQNTSQSFSNDMPNLSNTIDQHSNFLKPFRYYRRPEQEEQEQRSSYARQEREQEPIQNSTGKNNFFYFDPTAENGQKIKAMFCQDKKKQEKQWSIFDDCRSEKTHQKSSHGYQSRKKRGKEPTRVS